jgi:uncharacterized protein with PQ loop repeat
VKSKSVFTYIILIICIILSVAVAKYFTDKKVDDIVLSQLDYLETSNVNYKVNYIDNEFYNDSNTNDIYVTQFVDNIDVDFNYFNSYSDDINGSYSYYTKATLEVYDPSSESNIYWNPEYIISDVESINFKGESAYNISESVNIDYQKYISEYNNYKNKVNFVTSAKLVIEFIISNDGVYTGINNIKHDATITLEIPLSDSSFSIKTSTTVLPESQSITTLSSNEASRLFIKIIACLCWLFSGILVVTLFIVNHNNSLKEGKYNHQLSRILTTYDSIIVNVENLPKLNDLSVINVTTFEELVDAQMEVRLPINFKEDKRSRTAKFVLIKNSLAWVYTLKDENK